MEGKERIPPEGRVVIASNHPLDTLDALGLFKLVSEIRSDVKLDRQRVTTTCPPWWQTLLWLRLFCLFKWIRSICLTSNRALTNRRMST